MPPRQRDAAGLAGNLAQDEQLFERRVRGHQECDTRRPAGRVDRVVHRDQRVRPWHRVPRLPFRIRGCSSRRSLSTQW